MNLEILLASIEIIIFYLNSPFIIMLIFSLNLLGLLIILCISLTFFKEILEKLSLIFKISLTLEDKTCIYNQLSLLLVFSTEFLSLFQKNFNFFRVSSPSPCGLGMLFVIIALS